MPMPTRERLAFEREVRHTRQCELKSEAFVSRCRGKRVLDVGCAGQARPPGDRGWLHGLLRNEASQVVGVDTNEVAVAKLQAEGFDVRLPVELGNDKFDVVVMGDVIEHVDDPVGFLRIYARTMVPSGRMLVSTPNAFSAVSWLSAWATGTAPVNAEHTMWFDPLTLAECARRAGLHVEGIIWLKAEAVSHSSIRSIPFTGVGAALSWIRPSVSEAFMLTLAA